MKFQKSDIIIAGSVFISIPDTEGILVELGENKSGNVGIYEIVNKFNGKRYIGKARDLSKRYRRHAFDLIRGIHHSSKMQEDYNKLTVGGTETINPETISVWEIFEFRVIKYCRESELTFWENILIKYLSPEYNIHKQKSLFCEEEE